MSEENVEVVRRMFELFNEWASTPEQGAIPIEFHTYAGAPEAGVYRGREAVLEYHERVFGQFESARIELEELRSAGDRVLVISRQYTVPWDSEAEIVQRVMDVATIRDGLIAERKPFSTRAQALEAAGLSE